MELRRILMGLYLLAFPAMMWGPVSYTHLTLPTIA